MHKYYTAKYHLSFPPIWRDVIGHPKGIFEVAQPQGIYGHFHIGNGDYGGKEAINKWGMKEISIEEAIQWAIGNNNLSVLKDICEDFLCYHKVTGNG